MMVQFIYAPFEIVRIDPLLQDGRINRCFVDGGPQPIYSVGYYINGDYKVNEFYEDELGKV